MLIRGTLREVVPRVPLFDFFPTARAVAERRMPAVSEVTEPFDRHGFELIADEVFDQETAPSLRAFHERIKLRAISTLELISDDDFEAGLERLRLATESETDPQPVIEPVNLLALRR